MDKKLTSERAHDYLNALELVNDRKITKAKEIFKQIAHQADSDDFQAQANADLVELASTKLELEKYYDEFQQKKNHSGEPQFAFGLIKKYHSMGDLDRKS